MFKNIQFRIILIFFVIGIVLIGGLGTYFIMSLNGLNAQIQESQIARNRTSYRKCK